MRIIFTECINITEIITSRVDQSPVRVLVLVKAISIANRA